MKKQIILICMSFIFIGCGTSTLQTKAKLTRTIVLDHSQKENKEVYLQVTNTAGNGGEDMDLYGAIKDKLTSKGYFIVQNSKGASYGLFVNVLFANNLKEANAIKSGTNLGATVGVGSKIAGSSRAGNMNQLAGIIGDKDDAGDMKSGIVESTTTHTEKDYEEFKTRAFAEAIKMDLKLAEALPILEEKVSRQITNLF